MVSSIGLLLFLYITGFGVLGDSDFCVDNEFTQERVCFVISTESASWFGAAQACSGYSHGRLLTFDAHYQITDFVTLLKQSTAYSSVGSDLLYYVGGVQIGDSWRWNKNYSTIDQEYWAEGEPNNWREQGEHCAAMDLRRGYMVGEGQDREGKLNDVPCTDYNRYICVIETSLPQTTPSPSTPQPQERSCCANCLNFNFMDCFSGGGNNPEYHCWMANKPYGNNMNSNGGNPYQSGDNMNSNGGNPYQTGDNMNSNGGNPYQTGDNINSNGGNPYQTGDNINSNGGNPYQTGDNMNSNGGNGANPYENEINPYVNEDQGGYNPYPDMNVHAGNPYQNP